MKPIVAAVIAAALLVAPVALAQDKPAQDKPAQPAEPVPPSEPPYQPGLGEIMSLQQMRHIKLWFAGNAANWPLANYEIGELGEGFDDVRKLLGDDIVDHGGRHHQPYRARLLQFFNEVGQRGGPDGVFCG